MKIRKLHIKNYKVFNDLELDFTDANGNTLDTIVLAGVNGCGKTTVLEIIRMMFNGTFHTYLLDFENTSIEIEFQMTTEEKYTKFLFNSKEVNGLHRVLISKISQGTKLYYLPINHVEENKSNPFSNLQLIRLIHLNSSKENMKELALKGIRDEIFKNRDITPLQSIEKAIKQITNALNGINLTTKLVDLESEELIFESANGQRIYFEDLSSGEQSLYFRAIYLSKLNPTDSIIMIDEPEDSLHPTWQQKVMKLYQNIGENNQVIVATHSPHIIGSVNADEVFLLEIDEKEVEAVHPKYTKGHSIKYVLEVMGANPLDTMVVNKVDSYLALIRRGLQETKEGLALKAEIDTFDLDPNSEEMRRLDLSLKRFKVVGV